MATLYRYDIIKRKKANGEDLTKLTAAQHLISSAEAGKLFGNYHCYGK